MSTARGKVKVDVHAVKRSSPIPTRILCECKHWNKPVDQNVIFGFRAICSDVGAHYGIIISKEGFQSGATASREHTNVHLLSFAEFQTVFFDEWKSGIFMRLAQMSGPFVALVKLGVPGFYDKPGLKEKLQGFSAFDKYEMFIGDRSFTSVFMGRDGLSGFPVEITDPRGDPRILNRVSVRSFRDFFEIAKQGREDAHRHFEI